MQGKLLVLRKEKGLSQNQVAKYLGISVTSYGDKERSKKEFTQDEMFLLGQLFDKPINDIFLPRKSL
ncbi:hypothetical protein JavanS292_0015 [Streptococcus satellite phage Javan292]|uniref:helix-turn-helix transcriptional regulator n=1 Tax=Streptococcus marmotae TaxID=1825069 RepID=UPI00082D8C14|nr:helix-turn-helix transcriptional regulator [Streptococcus marmotae]QBX08732.1 hypothetical protein JavanS292_0015 [Streptococcus satellite phage Javan292]QBX08754.1 hypothetical protein JavanS293_0017 [Streptococcus satellite phage Javan293]